MGLQTSHAPSSTSPSTGSSDRWKKSYDLLNLHRPLLLLNFRGDDGDADVNPVDPEEGDLDDGVVVDDDDEEEEEEEE